jgi:hypothetical protein
MSGKRVKALRREFVALHGRAPRKAERVLETRSALIGPDGRQVFRGPGKRVYWEQMRVVHRDEFRAFRRSMRVV